MIMKKIFSFILLLAGVTMVTSCGEDDATYTPVEPLEIVSNNTLFETAGGTGTITVKATGALTANTPAQWLTVAVSGNTVTVTAQENPSISGRSAQITLSAGGKTTNVTATQKGLAYGVKEGLEYEVDDMENVLELTFSNSLPGTVNSLVDWITPTLEGTKLTLTVAENVDKKSRIGEVVVKCSDYSDTIRVMQTAMVFSVNKDELMCDDNKATNFDVVIRATKKVSLSRDVDWIGAKWKNDSVLTVSISANAAGALRSGHLFVKSGSESESIFIAQYDFFKEASDGYYVFSYLNAKTYDWGYMDAMLSLEDNTLLLAVDEDLILPMPVYVDQKNKVLLAGPSTTFAGNYGPYFLYWVWRTADGSWSGYDAKIYSVGEFTVYEDDEDGSVYSSIVWEGDLDEESTIDAWSLIATKAEGLTSETVAGFLDNYYFPEMQKYDLGDGARAKARALKHHKNPRLNRDLKYVLRTETIK